MTPPVRLLAPRSFGCRTLVPVVREQTFVSEGGALVSVRPVALLIGDAGAWSIVLLEGDSIGDLDRQLAPAAGDPPD